MSDCQDFREELTAWVEGQLPARQHERISEHVTHCPQCAVEADSLRSAIAWQRRALRAVVSLDAVDPLALSARLRRQLSAAADDRAPAWILRDLWTTTVGRLALAGAAVSVAALVFLLEIGPGMVLIPLGLEAPPAAVARRTEFFKDYPMIERLDVLEHFDTVESVPLDDDSASQHG
jgi:predicted anti-sigma-YlaC factor YlaD